MCSPLRPRRPPTSQALRETHYIDDITTTATTASTATSTRPPPICQPVCAFCSASDVRLLTCARCLDAHYCGKDCQRADWPRHKAACKAAAAAVQQQYPASTAPAAAAAPAAAETRVLASKLKAATQLAKQREGREVATGRKGFRSRSEWVDFEQPKPEKQAYNARREVPLEAAREQRRLVPRNNERGVQCHGQGKRHQNPPMRVQPKGGKRQAKWSNPNPKASSGGASSAATKARKNFKAVQ